MTTYSTNNAKYVRTLGVLFQKWDKLDPSILYRNLYTKFGISLSDSFWDFVGPQHMLQKMR